ncbi:MAG: HAD family hydrolase [Ignavibacteria bacterium]|nr:HAD family hydrolase [Ignavibacteria bacterium]
MLSKKNIDRKLRTIKLVVCDVDGTLTNQNNKIGQQTKLYVKKLQEKGILFTFATQRIHSSVAGYAKELDIKIPFMTINGALIRGLNGTVLSKAIIPEKKVEKALELASKHYVRVALCYNDDILYTEDNSVLKDFMYRLGSNYKLVDSYDNYKDQVLEIIMLGNEKKVIKHIQKRMNFPYRLFLTARYYRSSSRYGVYHLEIRKSGTTKKTGLMKLAKHLNVRKEEIAVIGDWYNDRDLFEYGGFNVALQNAVPELKHMAHFITNGTNEEDGVGEFLEILYQTVS